MVEFRVSNAEQIKEISNSKQNNLFLIFSREKIPFSAYTGLFLKVNPTTVLVISLLKVTLYSVLPFSHFIIYNNNFSVSLCNYKCTYGNL